MYKRQVKYTPAGGKIAVSVVLWEMYVEVKVTDTGKGISESNQAAIFRRFYREEEVHAVSYTHLNLSFARYSTRFFVEYVLCSSKQYCTDGCDIGKAGNDYTFSQ